MEDNVIVASNSQMARNLWRLGRLFDRRDWLDRSRAMLLPMLDRLSEHGIFYSNWACLLAELSSEPFELVISGPDAASMRKELDQHYLPNVLLLHAHDTSKLPLVEGKGRAAENLIYVCVERSCQLPVSSVKEALDQLK